MSTPQPRLGESFTISISSDTLDDILFRPISGNFKFSPGTDASNPSPSFVVTAQAKKMGKQHIGPLAIDLNGTKFTSDQVDFEVVDSLPAVDKGLWIRKVMKNDSEFSILIDQRIPASPVSTTKDDGSVTTENKMPDGLNGVTLMTDNEIENIKIGYSVSTSDPQSIRLPGKELEFMYESGVYNFTIVDKKKPVIFRKTDFKNLPPDYKFEDIVLN